MSWANALTVIRTHLEAAGNAVSPKIPVVRLAAEQTAVRQITCEYDGDEDNPFTEGNTLAYRQVGEKLIIKVALPVASMDKGAAEDTEAMLQTIKEQIVSRLAGDHGLGGNSIGLEIGNASTQWQQWQTKQGGVAEMRVLIIPVTVALIDVSAIAL